MAIQTFNNWEELSSVRNKINSSLTNLDDTKADIDDIPDNTDFVDLTTDQTVAWDKTFSGILKRTEAYNDLWTTSWTVNLDYNDWNFPKISLNWDTTFTISNPNKSILQLTITDWDLYTITRPSEITWANDETAPTLSGLDVVCFWINETWSLLWDYQNFATI